MTCIKSIKRPLKMLVVLPLVTLVLLTMMPPKAKRVNADPVSLLWGALSWAEYTATAAEAGYTAKMAHDRYGVNFPTQQSANNFTEGFLSWAVKSGDIVYQNGRFLTAAGEALWNTGYTVLHDLSICTKPLFNSLLAMYTAKGKSDPTQIVSWVNAATDGVDVLGGATVNGNGG